MKHLHHIVPRHMGGGDEPSNLYECTIEQHAELHLALYLEHGCWQDYTAAMALSGQAGMETAGGWGFVGRKHTDKSKRKLSETRKKTGRYTGDEEQRWLEGAKRGGHTQGKKNAQSGHLARESKKNAAKYAADRAPIVKAIKEGLDRGERGVDIMKRLGLTKSQFYWYKYEYLLTDAP